MGRNATTGEGDGHMRPRYHVLRFCESRGNDSEAPVKPAGGSREAEGGWSPRDRLLCRQEPRAAPRPLQSGSAKPGGVNPTALAELQTGTLKICLPTFVFSVIGGVFHSSLLFKRGFLCLPSVLVSSGQPHPFGLHKPLGCLSH